MRAPEDAMKALTYADESRASRIALQTLPVERARLTGLLAGALSAWDLLSPFGLVPAALALPGAPVALVVVTVLWWTATGAASVVLCRRLAAGSEEQLVERLAIYTVVSAGQALIWARLGPEAAYTAGVCAASVFVAEVALRRGVLAAGAVAAAPCVAGLLVRAAIDAPLLAVNLVSYAAGPVALGIGIRWYVTRQVRIAESEARARREAAVTAATLRTRSDVQLGAGGDVADRLQGALFRLSVAGVPGADARRAAVAERKAAAAGAVRDGAAYLGDVLRAQAAAARANEPATARHHFFELAAESSSLVVPPAQAERLRTLLDGVAWRGVVPVRALAHDDAGALRLLVGEHVMNLPPQRGPRRLHLAPLGFVAAALLQLALADPTYHDVPWPLAALTAASAAVLGWAAHRLLRVLNPAAERWIAAFAAWPLVAGMLLAVTAGQAYAAMEVSWRRLTLPVAPMLSGWAFVIGAVWHRLSRRSRAMSGGFVAAATIACAAAYVLLGDVPASEVTRAVPGEVVFPAVALLGTRRLVVAAGRGEERVTDAVAQQTSDLVRRAAESVRAAEVAVFREDLRAARQLFRQAPRGPAADAAGRELAAAAEALTRLEAGERTELRVPVELATGSRGSAMEVSR